MLLSSPQCHELENLQAKSSAVRIPQIRGQWSSILQPRFPVPAIARDGIDSGMKNPFPGMNPWLQEYWRDVHAKLLVYASDQLNGELPPGLQARVDERLAIASEEDQPRAYLPDVAVTESWDRPAGPVLGLGGQAVAAAEPVVVDFGDAVLRHLEIVDSRAHVVTAIELLSLSKSSIIPVRPSRRCRTRKRPGPGNCSPAGASELPQGGFLRGQNPSNAIGVFLRAGHTPSEREARNHVANGGCFGFARSEKTDCQLTV